MYNESGTGKNGNNGFIRMKTIAEGQIFSDFNAYDYIYVDKTDYIFNILTEKSSSPVQEDSVSH